MIRMTFKPIRKLQEGRIAFSLLAAVVLTGLIVGTATLTPVSAAAGQTAVTTSGVKTAESEAGNLLADAIRAAANADIGLIPAAAFRTGASVPRPLNGEQASNLVDPSSDEVVVLSLRGDQIMAALERSISFAPQPSSGFLQVSGLRFTYDSRKDGGKRVVSVTVAGGQPLDASRTYKVATTRPLANGQQGYFQIWDKSAITASTGKSLAAAVTEYARAHGNSLSPTLDGRINQTEK